MSRPWDPATIPLTDAASKLVEAATEAQFLARQEREASVGIVARRNRGTKARKEKFTVGALVLDTLAHQLTNSPLPLVIKLDKNWLSAGPKDLLARNRTVTDRLYDLEAAGWLKADRSARLNGRIVTLLAAGPQLLVEAQRLGVTLDDIGVEIGAAEIELKGRKPKGAASRRPVLIFEPNAQTEVIEGRLRLLNEYLHGAKLAVEPYGDLKIDSRRRRVTRTFLDGSFERGGRLGGPAFWLSLRKDIRRAALRIDGEPIAEVDLRAAMPAIAYGLEGVRPASDPYSLERSGDIPRDAVKLALMQMMWTEVRPGTPLSRAARALIPKTYRAGEVFDFIREHNAPIAGRLGGPNPCGAELMWHESEIIIEATLRCFSAGFTALPLHDALLTSTSRADEAGEILSAVFRERMGVPPDIKIEFFGAGAVEGVDHGAS